MNRKLAGLLVASAALAGTPAQAKSFWGGKRAVEFDPVSTLFGSVAVSKC